MEPRTDGPPLTRETAIRRDAAGNWFDGPDRIGHANLTRSFDRWIDVAPDGRYCLKNGINWAYVAIEGPPFFVRSVALDHHEIELHLSGDLIETLAPETLRQGLDGALYCKVRGGNLVARFDNYAVTQLAPILSEDEEGVFLTVNGRRFRPPIAEEPMEMDR